MLEIRNAGAKPSFNGGEEWSTESLLYVHDKPAFKFGPLSETTTFAYKMGSSSYNIDTWSKWQMDNGMGYVRCYPEAGFGWVSTDTEGRLYPFDQVEPLKFDLDKFNIEYWDNFREVGNILLEREVIIHLQLVQVCYFKLWDPVARRWQQNYWNPANNVNEWTKNLEPTFPFSDQNKEVLAHWKKYVFAILDAVGDLGNVLLDIGNELHGQKKWLDWNLEIINEWETAHKCKVLKGLDYTHMPSPVDVLGDDRFDVIMTHGEFVDNAPLLRRLFGKPIVSVNSRDSSYLGLGEGHRESADSNRHNEDRFRRFHYRCLMNKVQGIGDYGKIMGGQEILRVIDEGETFVTPEDPGVMKFAREAKILTDFYNELIDYASLIPNPYILVQSPENAHPYCMVSERELLIYLDVGMNLNADGLVCKASSIFIDTAVETSSRLPFALKIKEIVIIHPETGERISHIVPQAVNGLLEIKLPEFKNDLLIYVC